METIVLMIAIGWVPQADGTLKEAWRIEEQATIARCLQMNTVFSGGGKAGAITVKCGDFASIDAAINRPQR